MSAGDPAGQPLAPGERRRRWVEVGVAAGLGFAAVVVPVLVDPGRTRHGSPFLPFVGDAVEGLRPAISMPLLALAGFLLGLFGRAPPWLVGAATMLAFPVWSAIDMVADSVWRDGTGHSLLPFEWCLYAGLSLLGVAGAYVGRLLQPTPRTPHAP